MQRYEYQLRTRSLFHDVPTLLSPVAEEDESITSSPRSPRAAPPRTPWLPPARPYSPLPPLLIEVEKRVNKHDEPEEFYVELERKMRRIYRKLFIEGRNVWSALSSDDDDDGYFHDNNEPKETSNGDMIINEEIEEDIAEETVEGFDEGTDSERSLKRKTNSGNESDDEEVISKKSKSNDGSSTDVLPESSSKEFRDGSTTSDETAISSLADNDDLEIEQKYAEVRNIVGEESIDESNYVERDDKSTSESVDYIKVNFQADVHRAILRELRSNDSSSTDVLPKNSSKEISDETTINLLADKDNLPIEDKRAEVQRIIEEESIHESNNVERDDNSTSESVDYTQVTFQADVHMAYSDEPTPPKDESLPPSSDDDEMDDEIDDEMDDTANGSVQDPEEANEEMEELQNNNEVSGSYLLSVPDRGENATPPRAQPERVHDEEPPGEEEEEETSASLDENRVSGSYLLRVPDRGEDATPPTPPRAQHERVHDEELPGEEEKGETSASLDENRVSGSYLLSVPDRGEDATPPRAQPERVHDEEPPGEETSAALEDDRVAGSYFLSVPDREDATPPRAQNESVHDEEPPGEETSTALEDHRVPYNTLSALAPDREVELMRAPDNRPSTSSLPERRMNSNEYQQIDFEFLRNSQDSNVSLTAENGRDSNLQINFEEANNPQSHGNILYGKLKVFKLCRCKNHVCDP